jgi:hypothetical protein
MNPVLVSLFGESLAGRKKKSKGKKISFKKKFKKYLFPAAAVALGPVATAAYIVKKRRDKKRAKKATMLQRTQQARQDQQEIEKATARAAQVVENQESSTAESQATDQADAQEQAPEQAQENSDEEEGEPGEQDEAQESESPDLGFLGLSTDEAIAQRIYEATGDKVFKGFAPRTWKTALVVKMRDIHEQLKKSKPNYTPQDASWKMPEVSENAHRYFMQNKDKIKGIVDRPGDILKPLRPVLIVAGIAAAAYLVSQVRPLLKK